MLITAFGTNQDKGLERKINSFLAHQTYRYDQSSSVNCMYPCLVCIELLYDAGNGPTGKGSGYVREDLIFFKT